MEARSRSVEEIFEDFKGRRAAIIKALTTGTVPKLLLLLFLNFLKQINKL